MAVLFTSDLHLGHKHIIGLCDRNAENCSIEFETIEKMNDFIGGE